MRCNQQSALTKLTLEGLAPVVGTGDSNNFITPYAQIHIPHISSTNSITKRH